MLALPMLTWLIAKHRCDFHEQGKGALHVIGGRPVCYHVVLGFLDTPVNSKEIAKNLRSLNRRSVGRSMLRSTK